MDAKDQENKALTEQFGSYKREQKVKYEALEATVVEKEKCVKALEDSLAAKQKSGQAAEETSSKEIESLR